MTRWQLGAFASPVAPLTVAFLPLVLLLPAFYVQDMGLGVAAVGGALIFSRLVDALADPLVGILSDRTTSRWGRRRPWIIIGTPLLLVGVWLLYVPPFRPGVTALYLDLSLVYVGWTCVFIPHQSWSAELVTAQTGRGRLNMYMGFFNAVGTLLCILLPFLFLGPQQGAARVPYAEVMRLLAAVIIVVLPITVLLCLLFNRERPSPAVRADWRSTFTLFQRNRPFGRLIAGNLCLQMSLQLWTAAQTFYLVAILALPDALLLLLVVNQGFALVTVPAWGALAQRVGRARGLALSGVLMIAGLVLLLAAPRGSLWGVIPSYLCFGAASVGKWMLPIALAGDATDADERTTGRRDAGLHLAVLYFTSKLGIAAGGLMLIIFGLVGFSPRSAANSASALHAVRYLGTLLPACFSGLGAWVLWNLRFQDEPSP